MPDIYDYNDPADIAAWNAGAASQRTVWDIEYESGPTEILMPASAARDLVERHPARYRISLPAGMEPGPKSGTATHHRPGRIVLSCLVGLLLALATLLPIKPADAALLCAARTQVNAAGSQVAIPNLSKTYVSDGQGCVAAFSAGDVAILKANGWSPQGNERHIVFATGVATGTTSFEIGVLPPGAYIREIFASNATANATAGIGIGTTSGGTDVVTSITCGANCLAFVADGSLSKRVFSLTAQQPIYASGLSTGWNSANVTITVVYGFL